MKKLFILLMAVTMIGMTSKSQDRGGFQRRTVEERVKMVHDKIDSAFKPAAEKLTAIDAAFTDFYKAQDKMREEMMAGGERPDMQAMRAKMEPIMNERDEKLKKALTEEQYKKWKEEIEPSMRPQRGPRQ